MTVSYGVEPEASKGFLTLTIKISAQEINLNIDLF
jgi:hypothetical protein